MTRALIVDDREENLYYLQVLLEGNGFEVDVASNGSEALDKARARPPDLVVTDLLMPVMDGYTLLRHWKADPRLSHLPFVVYTATYTDEGDEHLARELGADAFIVKPLEPQHLLARILQVREAAARGATPGSTPREDPGTLLKAYNQVLVRKLEEKMLQLEQANRTLEQDIVERNRAREQLEQSAALLRFAGRAARLGGWALKAGDRTVTWSDVTCIIHGVPAGYTPSLEEALGFYLPGDRERVRREMAACLDEGHPFDFELPISTASGRRIWVRAIGEALFQEDGSISGMQGAIQDISDRKLLESRVLRAQQMESIATLTGGMAHDLNNVLAPILLSIPILKEELADPAFLEILNTMESCARRGTEMVKQVLSFARGADRARLRVDLAQILGDLAGLARDSFSSDIGLRLDIADDLWRVDGDPTQIHQVFMNLLVNARDAMPEGGTITVKAENLEVDPHYASTIGEALPGSYVRVSVSDTGSGIHPEVLDRIFEPLFTTKPEGKGTGLGLSTAATILRDHGGFVKVYSEVGAGSTFQVHFPGIAREGGGVPSPSVGEPWLGNGEMVLVVDDEASVRSITRQTLEAFGYRVVTAGDGLEALEFFREHQGEIALVVTDMNMPRMAGPELIGALTQIDPAVRIIAASGFGPDEGVARAAEAGARHFLPKPYTADSLLAAIRESLR